PSRRRSQPCPAVRLFPAVRGPHALSLRDALPLLSWAPPVLCWRKVDKRAAIVRCWSGVIVKPPIRAGFPEMVPTARRKLFSHGSDRKRTRLNSSHVKNSYAVFCLKNKKSSGPSTG